MSTVWKVSVWDMAELARKTQRSNPFVKLAQHSFVFLDFWLYNLSWTRWVSQTWDTISVCNLFHCELWKCLNTRGFGWGKITDLILWVPIWCTIGWKTGGYACPILCSTQPCSSSTCQNNCKLKALNLGWSAYLYGANRDLGEKNSGKGISTWRVESRSSVIFTSKDSITAFSWDVWRVWWLWSLIERWMILPSRKDIFLHLVFQANNGYLSHFRFFSYEY